MKKVVSFSLWGAIPVYLNGAVRAVSEVHKHYPDWIPRFYLGIDVPDEYRKELIASGAEIHDGPDWGPWSGMFWRFLAAEDPEVDVMLSRDVDTKIIDRETTAVHQWLQDGAPFHIMRDHPKHEMPVMGGMWGCRCEAFRDIRNLILSWNRFDRYGRDQEFLARRIYPSIKSRAFIHSECIRFPEETIHPFPSGREGSDFVGVSFTSGARLEKEQRDLIEWINLGKPQYFRPHPWGLRGRARLMKLILSHKFKSLLKP